MDIRPATAIDKQDVMEFCRSIYPAGDYVEDTWDSWLADGCLHVVCEGRERIGIFNVSIHRGQGWVEGTRVHPNFRRRGTGTAILEYSARFVRYRGGHVVRSFIEESNMASLGLARKSGWERGNMWSWYRPGSGGAGSFHHADKRKLDGALYVDSWRAYDLDGSGVDVVFLRDSAATVIRSAHYRDTSLLTVLEARNLSELAAYALSLNLTPRCMRGWFSGVHIVSCLNRSLFEGHFERMSSYYLVSKDLRPQATS